MPHLHEKSDGIRWFTMAELDDPKYGLRDNIKHYAKTALATLTSH